MFTAIFSALVSAFASLHLGVNDVHGGIIAVGHANPSDVHGGIIAVRGANPSDVHGGIIAK